MKKIKQFFADFKKFISRGNIVDMAIGVIVASAFTAIVTALTNKIIMPCINWLLSLGGAGLDSAYTFLKKAYLEDGVTIDLANSAWKRSVLQKWTKKMIQFQLRHQKLQKQLRLLKKKNNQILKTRKMRKRNKKRRWKIFFFYFIFFFLIW